MMSINGNWFVTNFITVGGGSPNPETMKDINNACQPENWTTQTRVQSPWTGEVMSGAEFQAHCDNRLRDEGKKLAHIATLEAMAETTLRKILI